MANKPRTPHRIRIENEMIRRREKQSRYEELWSGRKQYYEKWEKKNTKLEEWTSPRYFENNNKLIEDLKNKREREEKLEIRRDKLRKLFNEEEKLYQVELMVHKTKNSKFPRQRVEDVPTEVLKELNLGLKLDQEERRRHEAELQLHHQWRQNNPILRHYERMQRGRDLKLSWLDQQIESRMQKEKEEEECRKILKEREKMLKEVQARDEEHDRQLTARRAELKNGLDQQVEELKLKNKLMDQLKKQDEEEQRKEVLLLEIESQRIENENKKKEWECALYNVKQYKMKLKKKAEMVQNALDDEKKLMATLKDLEIAERIQEDAIRKELGDTMKQFLKLIEEQKKLERYRLRHLDFLFDSESKLQYEQQDEIWKEEEAARARLMKEVIETIQKQINQNLQKRRQEQMELLKEKEEMVEKIEKINREITLLKEEEERNRRERARALNEDVKMKRAKKKLDENNELKRIDAELERVRKEEERLSQKIMEIQRRQGPIRPPRTKLFF